MLRNKFLLIGLMAACLAFGVQPASAQASRTWVSGLGNDADPCSRTAPCKTFAGASSRTHVDGEINCLDPGGFGSVTITKSITIDCHEVFASVLSSGTNGIIINFDAFAAADVRKTVRIRNLNFNGTNTGLSGITILGVTNSANSTVIVEDVMIDGFFGAPGRGINDGRVNGGKLIVTNTTIRNVGGSGVLVIPASGSTNLQVALDNVRSYHNNIGAEFGAGTRVMINGSTLSQNASAGVLADTGSIININRSILSHNANGVQTAGGTVTLSNSDIAFNTSNGILVSGGTVSSFGNNRINSNAAPGTVPGLIGAVTNDHGQQ